MGQTISNNGFPRVSVMRGGKHCSAYKIDCKECSAHEHIFFHHDGGLPATIVIQKLRAAGWHVSHNRSNDLCPHHRMLDERKGKQPKGEEPMGIVKSFLDLKKPPVDITANDVAAGSREMEPDERRIIFAKLNEVYLDKTKGYAEGWTDAAVARDLGVPRQWVEKVRDEFFGPVKENDDIRKIRGEITEEISQYRAMAQAVVESAKSEANRINQRADRLEKRLDLIEKSLK